MDAITRQHEYIYSFGVVLIVMKYVPNSSQSIRLLIATVVVVSVASFGVGPALAQSDQPGWADEMFGDFEGFVSTYNENVDASDLGIAADQLKNERVNLIVTDGDGTQGTASFRMNAQLQIQELEQGTRDDATLQMTTDRATIDRILGSNNPTNAFQNALTDGDIRIDGIGLINSVKWAVINVLASLF